MVKVRKVSDKADHYPTNESITALNSGENGLKMSVDWLFYTNKTPKICHKMVTKCVILPA
jgi:hypothetical protein